MVGDGALDAGETESVDLAVLLPPLLVQPMLSLLFEWTIADVDFEVAWKLVVDEHPPVDEDMLPCCWISCSVNTPLSRSTKRLLLEHRVSRNLKLNRYRSSIKWPYGNSMVFVFGVKSIYNNISQMKILLLAKIVST